MQLLMEEPDASFLLSAGDLDVSLLRCPKLSSESWAQWAETLQEDTKEKTCKHMEAMSIVCFVAMS